MLFCTRGAKLSENDHSLINPPSEYGKSLAGWPPAGHKNLDMKILPFTHTKGHPPETDDFRKCEHPLHKIERIIRWRRTL